MQLAWKESIYLQREQLARILREPLARVAEQCAPTWHNREQLDAILVQYFDSIPHCTHLYCLDPAGRLFF